MKKPRQIVRPLKILLIEDNPADVELTRNSIQETKILADVLVAEDGELALQLLKSEWPDLILLDLSLPKVSGRDVLTFIKKDPILKTIPVIILSGSAGDIDIARSYEMGANSYIVKPVDATQFLEMIKSFGHFWFDVVELPPAELIQEHERQMKQIVSREKVVLPEKAPEPSTIRVLMIEDSEPATELIRIMLQSAPEGEFQFSSASTLEQGIRMLDSQRFDGLLLDLALPDSPPPETLHTIQARFPDIPVLIVTGRADIDASIDAVRNGAQDYLVKGKFEAEVLRRAIRYAIERKNMELQRATALISAIRSKEQAEKALWSRDEFISVAAHELRTPLTSLMLQTKFLIDRLETKEPSPPLPLLRKLVRTYDREVERLKSLVNNLLDVTRIDAGRLTITPASCDLVKTARVVVQNLESLLAEARCPVSLQVPPGLYGMWDCLRLEQVLTNLISNAAKYVRGRPIEVEMYRESDWAIIKVKDQGRGIAAEDLPKLFSRFERLGASRDHEGLGLGLYITRQIVDAHGGSIRAESRPGQGTTFIVTLPFEARKRVAA